MKTEGNRLLITELVLVVLLTLLNIIYNVSSKSYNFFAASDWKEIVTHPDDLDKIVLADLFSMEIQEEQAPESEPALSLEVAGEAEPDLPSGDEPLDEAVPAEPPTSMIAPPRFQGRDYATFGEWIAERVEYPDEAADNNLFGVVHVSFVVEKDGSLSDIKIARSIDPLLDNEALRVVAMSPKWTPAMAAGNPVSVRLTFSVDFSLEEFTD